MYTFCVYIYICIHTHKYTHIYMYIGKYTCYIHMCVHIFRPETITALQLIRKESLWGKVNVFGASRQARK